MAAEQQVTITDLDPQQLSEVKKQLDEVGTPLLYACSGSLGPGSC